ncbi:MAG TPA: DUF222 domain-containing protein [Candidatus Dormibacteraeota bacterium]|nr:DUF222 domain-containing protein [Candidatus Dormibacteraeota bacterium]
MEKLRAAIEAVEAQGGLDPAELSALVDRLQALLCRVLDEGRQRGDHMLSGNSPAGWAARECQMSKHAAADRLCVGAQLDKLPEVARALRSGEIGYQAASVLCHLQERLGDAGYKLDEREWVTRGREWSLKSLSAEAAKTWHAVDPAGFNLRVEEAHERRQLFINECGDMYRIDGWLELSAGAIVKAAVDSLSKPLGADDGRSPRQRRADALTEAAIHSLDVGIAPRRNGARPHIAVHTTIEGLKGELGAPASELGAGVAISSRTVQRLACDGLLHRVLKADSMVIDVGRAKRTAQPAQRRGLEARYKHCAWPGCDRPIDWTHSHHVDFWERGGRTDLKKMLPLCYHHHRLVHEGGWQVVMAGERVEFIPPDPLMVRRRWGALGWRSARQRAVLAAPLSA